MNKIKKFVEDHKTGLCIAGAIAATGVSIVAAYVFTIRKCVGRFEGENIIHWRPSDKRMDLERVEELLELNKDNSSQFAIFKGGDVNPDEYQTILLDNTDDFVSEP